MSVTAKSVLADLQALARELHERGDSFALDELCTMLEYASEAIDDLNHAVVSAGDDRHWDVDDALHHSASNWSKASRSAAQVDCK